MAEPLSKSSASNAGIDWAGLFKVLALQVVVLVALAAAAITYVNWTSDAAVMEFMSTGEPSLPDVSLFAQPRQVASSKQQCNRK
jgi:hypothetical protein